MHVDPIKCQHCGKVFTKSDDILMADYGWHHNYYCKDCETNCHEDFNRKMNEGRWTYRRLLCSIEKTTLSKIEQHYLNSGEAEQIAYKCLDILMDEVEKMGFCVDDDVKVYFFDAVYNEIVRYGFKKEGTENE